MVASLEFQVNKVESAEVDMTHKLNIEKEQLVQMHDERATTFEQMAET